MIMLLAALVGLTIHFTSLYFLQFPVLPPTRLKSPFFARFVGDVLHINRAVIARVCRKERIATVWWVDRRSLLRGH